MRLELKERRLKLEMWAKRGAKQRTSDGNTVDKRQRSVVQIKEKEKAEIKCGRRETGR
jgi:hypothetical protein